jgi:hypothetical protein
MPKLTVRNGSLFLGGAPCREIGLNAYSLGEKTWGQAVPDNAYITDLPLIKSLGYNVVKIMAAPFPGTGTYGWGNVVGSTTPTTWASLNAGYRSRIEAIMDAAGNAGLTVLAVPFWNYQAIPDMLGESYSMAFRDGSASQTYWREFARVFALRFANHEAYGAHIPYTEWPAERHRAFGVPPFVGWSAANVRGIADMIMRTMKAVDPSRCTIANTIAPAKFDLSNKWERRRLMDDSIWAAGVADVVDWHVYPQSAYVGANWELQADSVTLAHSQLVGLTELLAEMRQRAVSRGKVFACTEFGVDGDIEPTGTTRIEQLVQSIRSAGIQLSLAWDWNPRTSLVVTSQNRWSIYPGYEYNGFARGNEYLGVIKNSGVSGTVSAPVAKEPARFARFTGSSGGSVVVPAAARYNSQQFTVMAWIRQIGRSSGFARVAQYRNEANDKGWVFLYDSNATAPYIDTRKAGPASAYNTAGRYGVRLPYRWHHYAVVYSNTSAQLFLDGREWAFIKYADSGYAPHDGTTDLFLGFNGIGGGSSWARIDMAEFGLFDRLLTPQEIFDSVHLGVRPSSPVGWWPFQSDANDVSGFSNHGTAGAGLTFVGNPLPRTRRAA